MLMSKTSKASVVGVICSWKDRRMDFGGYRSSNGSVGTRNYVGIRSTVVCANEVTAAIGGQVQGTARFTHQQGCCQTPLDIRRVG